MLNNIFYYALLQYVDIKLPLILCTEATNLIIFLFNWNFYVLPFLFVNCLNIYSHNMWIYPSTAAYTVVHRRTALKPMYIYHFYMQPIANIIELLRHTH